MRWGICLHTVRLGACVLSFRDTHYVRNKNMRLQSEKESCVETSAEV